MSKPNSKKGHEPKINVSELIKKWQEFQKQIFDNPADESLAVESDEILDEIAEHIDWHYSEKQIRKQQELLPKEEQRKESTYEYEAEFSNHELNFILDEENSEMLYSEIRHNRWEIISECGTRGLVEISTNTKTTFNSYTYTIEWYRKILVDKTHQFVE